MRIGLNAHHQVAYVADIAEEEEGAFDAVEFHSLEGEGRWPKQDYGYHHHGHIGGRDGLYLEWGYGGAGAYDEWYVEDVRTDDVA